MATVEPEPDQAGDPFGESAAAIHDASAERADLQSLLASASAVVQALETALDRAKAHESELRARVKECYFASLCGTQQGSSTSHVANSKCTGVWPMPYPPSSNPVA